MEKSYQLKIEILRWMAGPRRYEAYSTSTYPEWLSTDRRHVLKHIEPANLEKRGPNQMVKIWLVDGDDGDEVLLYREKTNWYQNV